MTKRLREAAAARRPHDCGVPRRVYRRDGAMADAAARLFCWGNARDAGKIDAMAAHKIVNPHIVPEMTTAKRTKAAINAKLRSAPSSSK